MKKTSLLDYFFLIAIITIIFGVMYVAVQQSYRSGADDPQIQLARDISSRLIEGESVDKFFTDSINIAQSLSPFLVLYDANEKPIRSSGYLNGRMPEMPPGVFDVAKINSEHNVTWQPQKGLRLAMVIVKTNSSPVGFVAAGRSLQEVEIRVHNLVTIIVTGWILCVGLILLYGVVEYYKHRINN